MSKSTVIKNYNYKVVKSKNRHNVSRALIRLKGATFTAKGYGTVSLEGEDLEIYNQNLKAAIEATKAGQEMWRDHNGNLQRIPRHLKGSGSTYHSPESDFASERRGAPIFAKADLQDGRTAEIIEINGSVELLIRTGDSVTEKFNFRKIADAQIFLTEITDKTRGGIELLRPSSYYQKDVELFYKTKEQYEEKHIDKVHIVPRFAFIVAVHERLHLKGDLNSSDLAFRNSLVPIIRNRLLPNSTPTHWKKAANEWVEALLTAPQLNRNKDISQRSGRDRIRLLKQVLRCFASEDPTGEFLHLAQMADHIDLYQKKTVVKFTKLKRGGKVNPKGTLNPNGHWSPLSKAEVNKLLDFLADEDIEKYHYAIVSLSVGVRPTEAVRLTLGAAGFIERDKNGGGGWEINMSKLVEKTDGTKVRAPVSVVANLILFQKEQFPIRPFDSTDWNTGYRRNFRSRLGFDFQERRLRTTCAVMLTICENEMNDLQYRSTRQFLKIRGGWSKDSSIDSDVYAASNVYGSTSLPGRFFEIETIEQRIYSDENDLLEGQTSWDAFLLKHFIQTHFRRIDVLIKDSDKNAAAKNELLTKILSIQTDYFNFSGWARKHNAGNASVIRLLNKGLLWEAFGELSKLLHWEMQEEDKRRVRARIREEHQKYQRELLKGLEAEVTFVKEEIDALLPEGKEGNDLIGTLDSKEDDDTKVS